MHFFILQKKDFVLLRGPFLHVEEEFYMAINIDRPYPFRVRVNEHSLEAVYFPRTECVAVGGDVVRKFFGALRSDGLDTVYYKTVADALLDGVAVEEQYLEEIKDIQRARVARLASR